MLRYFTIYKPFQVLSQFTSNDERKTLSDFFAVPSTVYPVGRLDYDSEGLLILTDDTRLNSRLLNPAFKHEREYLVQVEGLVTPDGVKLLQPGLYINIDGKAYKTLPCSASIMSGEPVVPERTPPIRFRKNVPTSWLSITLTEGKNRQVRKMTAAIGNPTLRLIRKRIEMITLDGLQPGQMKEWTRDELYAALFADGLSRI